MRAGQDLRDAIRQLRRHRGFAAATILTLSLSLGGITAVFALADPILFRPLPYPRSHRLVQVGALTERGAGDLFAAEYARLLDDRGAFASLTTYGLETLGIVDRGSATPQSVYLTGVEAEFFDVFGVEPMLGRRFLPEEHRGDRVVVITHAVWQTYFEGRPDIIGQTLVLRGSRPVAYEIVGVLPADFELPPVRRVADTGSGGCVGLVPVSLNARALASPGYFKAPIARLRDGVGIGEAAVTVQRAIDVVAGESPQFAEERRTPLVRPLGTAIHADARTPMVMLLSVTVFVVLIACANLAHLFMVRIAGRRRELATRVALGASRKHLVRLLVSEAAVVTAAGTAGALALGQVLEGAALVLMPAGSGFDRLAGSAFDWRVVAFAGVVAAFMLVCFGLVPALAAVRRDMRSAQSITTTPRRGMTAGALLVAQTATTASVLVTALLLASSFARIAAQDLGFDPHGIYTLAIASPANLSNDVDRKRHTNVEMRRRVEELLGRPVALAGGIPGDSIPFEVRPVGAGERAARTIGYPVSAEFFGVFRIRLTRGRLLSQSDELSGAPVIVVDERAAMLAWPGQDPIGRLVQDPFGSVRRVVGVVEPLKTRLVSERFQEPTAFVPLPVVHERGYELMWRGTITAAESRAIQEEMRRIDPDATALVRPFTVFTRQLEAPRFLALLLGALGLVAVTLTIVGVYGIVSHGLAERTREMAIRIALGAASGRIARLIAGRVLGASAMGVALGLSLSVWWTETLRSLLFGVTPHDWRMFAGTAVGLLLLAVAATLRPVRLAARVDPLLALKSD